MYHLGDVVQMKKPHACGENKWEILRLGADIRLKCMGCGHMVMIARSNFNKKLKKILTMADDPKTADLEYYVPTDQIARPNLKK